MRSHPRRLWLVNPLLLLCLSAAAEPPVAPATIVVTVRLGDDAGPPMENVSVSIVGRAAVKKTNAAGVATLKINGGSWHVRAKRTGYCDVETPVTTVDGGTTNVAIHLCADLIRVSNSGTDSIRAVLTSRNVPSSGDASCETDVWSGVATIGVTKNAAKPGSGTPPCHGTVAVLAPHKALFFANASLPWTDAWGDSYAVILHALIRVPLTIWQTDPSPDKGKTKLIQKIRGVHLQNAASLFESSMVGMVLSGSEAGGDPLITDVSGTAIFGADANGGCDQLSTVLASSAYDPARINVYYVKQITGEGVLGKGFTCVSEGAPNVIFVLDDLSDPYTLVHEIGHALGLDRPDWGHTDQVAGFQLSRNGELRNVMAENANPATYFSVGQVVQMNVSDKSWVNLPTGAGSVRSRQLGSLGLAYACGCPETQATADCPMSVLDIHRTNHVNGQPPWRNACRLEAPAKLTVHCGAYTPITATLWQDAAEGPLPAGAAGAIWVSLNPAIATIASSHYDPADKTVAGAVRASVHGKAAGSATIRAWGGGSFTDVAVTVTC